jgi:hypothetical protein
MECARCHDHKFDPITQRDYYRMFAFFNQVPENGEDGRIANAPPLLATPTKEQAAELAQQEQELSALDAQLSELQSGWKWEEKDRAAIEQIATEAAALVSAEDLEFHLTADDAEPKEKAWSFPTAAPALTDGVAGRAWVGSGEAALAKIEGTHVKFKPPAGMALSLWIAPAADNLRDVALLSNQNYTSNPAAGDHGKGQELRLVDGEIELRMNARFPAYAVRIVTEGANIQAGGWQHVALSYDVAKLKRGPRASTIRMFVDGREVRTRAISDGLDIGAAPSVAAYLLGADGDPAGAKYRGAIDDLRVFKRVLTARKWRRYSLPRRCLGRWRSRPADAPKSGS